MKRNLSSTILAVTACAALLLLLGFGLFELLFAPKGEVFSEEENRMLAQRPPLSGETLSDGSFTDGVERFLADHFPGRSGVITFTQDLRQVGSLATWEDYARVAEDESVPVMEYSDDLTATDAPVTPRPTRVPTPTPAPSPTPTETSVPTDLSETPEPTSTPEPTPTPRPTKPPVDLSEWPREFHFYLIDGQKKSAAVTQKRRELENQAALYNAYASLLPEGGRMVITIVPISTRAARIRSYADPQGMTSEIEPFLHAITAENISVISAADLLSEPLLNGEYVYFRSDRHWTPYGAHIVISRCMEEIGETLPPYDSFQKTQEYPFLGTIYRDTRNRELEKDPDTLDLLIPTHPVTVRRYSRPDTYVEVPFIDQNAKPQDRYACYLGGPSGQITVIERTDVDPDKPLRTCFMITDSYGLCTTPYFMEIYDRVIVYDPRYYDKPIMGALSDLIERYEVRDIFLVAGEVDVYDPPYLQLLNRHF